MEACRARFEGVKTPALRGALESVETMAYEASLFWRRTSEGAATGADERQAEQAASKAADDDDLYEIYLPINIGNCGFARGESVEANRADDLKVGEIASAWYGDDNAFTGRVVSISDEEITLRQDEEERTFDRRRLRASGWLGRVNPKPVGRDDGLTDEQRAELKRLRKKLQEAESDTDWENVLSSTRYKIEKQIYDIEHPAGGDPDDWGAWEEKGGADGNG